VPRAFVLMPFAPEFDEIYNLFITPTLVEAGFEVFRADDMISNQNILRDIVSAIENSDLVVADLTTANPNVYYELGIAHALGRPVILLVQDIAELPFDLRAYRVVPYKTHFASIRKAQEDLRALAIGARTATVAFGNPVSDFRGQVPALAPLAAGAAGVLENSAAESEGELGFIDHMVDYIEGFARLTEIVEGVNGRIERLGEDARLTGEEFESASQNPSSGTARQVQKVARRLADKEEGFTEHLKSANSEYSTLLHQIENAVEGVLAMHDPSSKEECVSLQNLLAALREAEDGAFDGRQGLVALKGSMDRLPRIERRLNRATAIASSEVQKFIDNIDQTLAVIGRARNLGERILRQSDCSKWQTEEPDTPFEVNSD
jgi:hypothetical protein